MFISRPPVLQYVAQLFVPAERILDAESKALRKLAPGPGNWIVQRDVENLAQLGFKYDLRTIFGTAMAAKLPVMRIQRLMRKQKTIRLGIHTWKLTFVCIAFSLVSRA